MGRRPENNRAAALVALADGYQRGRRYTRLLAAATALPTALGVLARVIVAMGPHP